MTDLATLDQYIGKYVRTTRPATTNELHAYPELPEHGGEGWVVAVDPPEDITVNWGAERETLHGRMLVVDYGMGWLITENTTVEEVTPQDPSPGIRQVSSRQQSPRRTT